MEVMVGSSFGIGMAAYVRDRSGVSAQDKALFLADESGHGGAQIGIGNRIGIRVRSNPPEEEEDSSSSIGEGSENEEEEEEEEEDDDAVSFQGGLDSFSSSLEDSLPIKRGLSNHYVGKSKSFGNLMEASKSNAKDLEKRENPYNKRRRLLIANKLRRRSLSTSVPLLALQETNEDEDVDDEILKLLEKRDLMAQTQSCFCLSSLQEEDDDDGDDDDDQ